MARTTKEIYDGMITVKEGMTQLAALTSNSATAIWRLILWVTAAGIQTLERIFDTHQSEVNEIIENILPHRPKWYRDKALNFMVDKLLIPDTDRYDTTGMTDEEIETARVVKFATAIEEPGSSVLVIKIATGTTGNLKPLPGGTGNNATGQAGQFRAYIDEIRDAGVRWNLVNKEGDDFYCEIDIYYSPLLVPSDVSRAVQDAIKMYLNGLPFNGEYSNMALIDAVQVVDGVLIADLKFARIVSGFINAKIIPEAGYFTYLEENITLNLIPHSAVR